MDIYVGLRDRRQLLCFYNFLVFLSSPFKLSAKQIELLRFFTSHSYFSMQSEVQQQQQNRMCGFDSGGWYIYIFYNRRRISSFCSASLEASCLLACCG
jgi:hypothetical protein